MENLLESIEPGLILQGIIYLIGEIEILIILALFIIHLIVKLFK